MCDRSEWRGIETAPKDGTRVLLAWPRHVDIGFYGPKFSTYGVNYGDSWGNGTNWSNGIDGMTHWMPLPDPPEVKQ